MVKPLFDTNILIDLLNAVPEAREELARYEERAASVITWMEVMIGAGPAVEVQTRRFLSGFRIIPLTSDVAERAFVLRQRYRVKLPDAVIWSSAGGHSMLLVTRNSKDFSPDRSEEQPSE